MSKTIYIGNSKDKYQRIISVLEKKNIPYKSHTHTREGNSILPHWGTTRSFGKCSNTNIAIYEITVSNNDYFNAQNIVSEIVRN